MTALQRFVGAPAPGQGADGVLARFLEKRPRPRAGEVCELCAEQVGDDHRHVADLDGRGLLCVCRGCALLFTRPGAAGGRYRVVPERYLRMEPFALSALQWSALQVPVGMAFFLRSDAEDRTVAFYPSPGGATASELALDTWEEIVRANPLLGELEADTEAALIRMRREGPDCFVLPVDRCYELVGQLRLHWRGFDGGQEVHERIERFFDGLRRRSRVVDGSQR